MAQRKKPGTAPESPAGLFLDTCVWLDLAGNHQNEPLLGALEMLSREHVIDLIVPPIVRDEFARNRDRIMKESGRSLSGALKRARAALWTYGEPKKRRKAVEALDDIDRRLVNQIDVTAHTVERIEKLFANSILCPTNDRAILQASNRALERKAPFHNGKNNFADAVIIELYAQLVASGKGQHVFVTYNTKDFSVPDGDQRLPHPDIASHFSRTKSRYFIRLVDALRALRPQQFAEAMYEHEFSMEPRTATEISEAIEELTDRVWYDRHMVSRYKVETGKTKILAKKDFGPQHYRASALDKLVVDDIWAGALKSAARMEKKYGKENLGPYSKFDWGMINGKLSALRWIMGDEWDMLDT